MSRAAPRLARPFEALRSSLPDRERLTTYAVLLATRGAYVLSRLLVALALPLVLSVEALGKFGVFSALVAALPVVLAFGLPEHASRQLNRGLNRPLFRVFLVQTALGFFGAFVASVLWLAIYPDIDRRTILIVAGVVALTLLRGNLGMVLIGRGAVIRSNLSFAIATSGPFFAIVAALLLPRGSVDLTTVCLAWLVTCLAGIAVALPGCWHDLVDVRSGRPVRRLLFLSRQVRIMLGLRHIYINQIIDLARTYLDRMILPLISGFHLAGIYNVFALATSVAVMVPNALCGQADFARLVASAREDWAVYRRTMAAGIVRAAAVAAVITAPLFFIKPAVEAVLRLDLDPGLYYVLSAGSMLAAMLAAVADYLWYGIYAARAERGLGRYALPTVALSVLLIVGGTAAFGLIGASLAVVATNACVALFRARVLVRHLARRMPMDEPRSSLLARLVPALARVS